MSFKETQTKINKLHINSRNLKAITERDSYESKETNSTILDELEKMKTLIDSIIVGIHKDEKLFK